jgi:glutathione S-transferase
MAGSAMAAAYILHGGGSSRSMLVEMVLAEAGAPYELREVDIRSGANRSPEFLAINPYGWVPALTTPDGETIAETPAINLWLCERHGLDLVPPPGDRDRGAFLAAFFNATGEVEPTLKRVFYAHRYATGPDPAPDDVARTRDLAWEMLADRLEAVERRLARTGPFFLGPRFSLADLTLAYWLGYAEHHPTWPRFPRLAALLDAARARPAPAPMFARQAEWARRWAERVRGG